MSYLNEEGPHLNFRPATEAERADIAAAKAAAAAADSTIQARQLRAALAAWRLATGHGAKAPVYPEGWPWE